VTGVIKYNLTTNHLHNRWAVKSEIQFWTVAIQSDLCSPTTITASLTMKQLSCNTAHHHSQILLICIININTGMYVVIQVVVSFFKNHSNKILKIVILSGLFSHSSTYTALYNLPFSILRQFREISIA
jgi:hypothetical protein